MDRSAGGKSRKKKLIEAEEEKEKRGGFLTAEMTPPQTLFTCPVSRKNVIGGRRLDAIEVQTC